MVQIDTTVHADIRLDVTAGSVIPVLQDRKTNWENQSYLIEECLDRIRVLGNFNGEAAWWWIHHIRHILPHLNRSSIWFLRSAMRQPDFPKQLVYDFGITIARLRKRPPKKRQGG